MIYLAAIIVIMLMRAVSAGWLFKRLCGANVTFYQAMRLTVLSAALNKLFITASGFVAGSYCSRSSGIDPYRAMGVFLISELLAVGGWILVALYYGAQFAFKAFWIFFILLLVVIFFLYYQRKKLAKAYDTWRDSMRIVWDNIIWCGIYAGVSMFFFALYYKFLFIWLNIAVPQESFLAIISLSFTAGYLSPSPSGLGVKDAALIGLLMVQGVGAASAGLVAVMDRVVTTVFWLVMGFLISADSLKDVWRNRKIEGR